MSDTNGQTRGTCNEALENMYLFLDNEIAGSEREHVQQHLDDCIPCLESFEFEAELKTVIKSRCKDDVPEHLYSRIRSSLRVEIQSTDDAGDGTSSNSSQGGIPNA